MKFRKTLGSLLALVSMFVVMFSITVFADTNCTVSIIGGGQLQPGAQVEVQVQLKAENSFSDTDVFITYDSEVLKYVSGDVSEAEDGNLRLREYFPEGTKEHTWTLTFKAVEEGTTRMKAENCWIKHFDAEAAGSNTASVMVQGSDFTVSENADGTANTASAQESAAPSATEAVETTTEAMSEEDLELQRLREEIANDGTMSCLVGREKWIVQETFPDNLMPYHFQVSSQFYKGVEVKAAKLTNAEYYLLYVKSEGGSQEKFCMYQPATKEFFDIQKIQMNDQYVLYLVAPGEADIPDTFKETTLQIGQEQVRAWQLENQEQLAYAADPNQFYIVCGYNQNGVGGWYLYDSGMNTFQRYVEMNSVNKAVPADAENTKLKNDYNQLKDRFEFMIECLKYVAIIFIALLLLLLIVNIADKKGTEENEKKLTKKEKKALKKAEKARRKEEERRLLSDDWDKDEQDVVEEKAVEEKAPQVKAAEEKATADVDKKSDGESLDSVVKALNSSVEPLKPVVEPLNSVVEALKEKEEDFSITDSMEELSRQVQAAMNEEQSKKTSEKEEDMDDLMFINLDD